MKPEEFEKLIQIAKSFHGFAPANEKAFGKLEEVC